MRWRGRSQPPDVQLCRSRSVSPGAAPSQPLLGVAALLLLLSVRDAAAERVPCAEGLEKVLVQGESLEPVHSAAAVGLKLEAPPARGSDHLSKGPHHGRQLAVRTPWETLDKLGANRSVGIVTMTASGQLLKGPRARLYVTLPSTEGEAAKMHGHSPLQSNFGSLAKNSSSELQKSMEAQGPQHRGPATPAAAFGDPLGGLGMTPSMRLLLALGEGTGSSVSNGAEVSKQALLQSMRMQDTAVMGLMLLAYLAMLSLAATLAYHQAHNTSPILYYADPRYHTAGAESHDAEIFLEAFSQPPRGVYLHIQGLTQTAEGSPGSIRCGNRDYKVDFNFSLDLSPWIVRRSSTATSESSVDEGPAVREEESILPEDLEGLLHFLAHDTNDLAVVGVVKEIGWPCWEELATNIKHQIRQTGYRGVISIDRTKSECMEVYKNTQWANFMHSRTLKVVLALSVVGWVVHAAYMWLRSNRLRIRCPYQINIPIGDYWELIAARLCALGFIVAGAAEPAREGRTAPGGC